MPIPVDPPYKPVIQHADSFPTDFRTGLAASTTDLGGGNGPNGKVGLDVNIIGGGLAASNLVGVKGKDATTITTESNPFPIEATDGALVTVGAKADSANTDSTSSWSLVSLLKGIWAKLNVSVTNPFNTLDAAQLVQSKFDYIALSNYTTDNQPQTVVYKTGGSGGTTVATLTLVYSLGAAGGNLTSVTRA